MEEQYFTVMLFFNITTGGVPMKLKKSISLLLAFGAVLASISCAAVNAEAATIKGDLNGDNNISLRDATLIQKITANLITPTEEQLNSGDFNNDGGVSALDSLEIQKYLCLDRSVVDTYSPNKTERINFINALNEDRQTLGLKPFEYNDATLAAGHQRAVEIMDGYTYKRPDGSQFWTILTEYNLGYHASPVPYQFFVVDDMNGVDCYESIKENYNGANQIYPQLMSADYTTLCVGAIQCGGSSNKWVIILN